MIRVSAYEYNANFDTQDNDTRKKTKKKKETQRRHTHTHKNTTKEHNTTLEDQKAETRTTHSCKQNIDK